MYFNNKHSDFYISSNKIFIIIIESLTYKLFSSSESKVIINLN